MILISIFQLNLTFPSEVFLHTIGNDSIGDLVKHLVLL